MTTSERITQDPQNPQFDNTQTQVISHQVDPRVHESITDTDLAHQAPAGAQNDLASTALGHIDRAGNAATTLTGGREISGISKKVIAAIAGGVTLGAGAIGVGMHLGNAPTLNEKAGAIAPANPNDLGHDINPGDTIVLPNQNTEVYSLDALEAMSAEEFKKLDANNQLRFLGEPVYDHVDSVKPFMKDLLSAEQLAILKLDEKLPKDKRNYTDQQILNEYAKILFYADSQGSNTKDGRKTLNVIIDANKLPDQYDNASERVGDAIGAMTDVKLVDASYPPLVNTTFNGVPFGGDGGRTMEAHMVKPDGSVMPNEQLTFQLIQFEGHQFWRLVDSSNPIEVQSDLEKAFPPSK